MNARLEDVLPLPLSTAECEEGPVISARPGTLSVKYDAERDEGIVWTTIDYEGALAHRFTPDVAVTEHGAGV
jgi:hypothetical protein